jgi:hypothetical protein
VQALPRPASRGRGAAAASSAAADAVDQLDDVARAAEEYAEQARWLRRRRFREIVAQARSRRQGVFDRDLELLRVEPR